MSIGRTSLLLTPLALVARTVAFFVPVAIARWYGVQKATDAFYWALSVPTFLLVLGGTTMGTVLVPVLAELRVKAPERVGPFLGATIVASAGVATALGVAVAVAAPFLIPLVTGFDAETQRLAVVYSWALVPFTTSVAVSAVCKSANEVHGRFAAPAIGPVLRAVVTMVLVRALRPIGPMALPIGLVVGNFTESFWLWGNLRAAGVRVLPRIGLPPELRHAALAFGPVLGGETMVALNLIVDKLFAGFLDEGAVSLLEYADRARMIPQTVLESTLTVVAFNAWAAAAARGDDTERRRGVATVLWWIALLSPPVLAGMTIGRVALVRVLYEGGAFEARHVGLCADTLGGYLPGVLFTLLGGLVTKALIVDGRYRLVLGLGLLSFTLNALLDFALMPPLGLVGLAIGTSITGAIVTSVSFSRLAPGLAGILPAGRVRGAVLVMGVCGALVVASWARGFAPTTIADPWLWVASVPCFVLLAWGVREARAQARAAA